MKFLFIAFIFLLLQSCKHPTTSRASASSDNENDVSNKEYTCGLEGTIEERIASCSILQSTLTNLKDFQIVAKLPNDSLSFKAGVQNMLLARRYIHRDKASGLLWSSPRRFTGPVESAVSFCANNNSLNRYFPKTNWRLPSYDEIRAIFAKNGLNFQTTERMLGSRKHEASGEIRYYDYHIKANEFFSRDYDNSDVVIVCVAPTY